MDFGGKIGVKRSIRKKINTSLIFIYILVNMLEGRYSVYYNKGKISLGRHINEKIKTISRRYE